MNGPSSNITIKSALDRMVDLYRRKPGVAQSTSRITARVEEGPACRITDGIHEVVADLPEVMGGNDSGPTPGYFARAGIAGYISSGIKMMAARAGHDFSSIEVHIENDFDDRATYGLCDGTAAPIETRVTIKIDSDLDQDSLRAFIEDALERDTWFLALRENQSVKTKITAKYF